MAVLETRPEPATEHLRREDVNVAKLRRAALGNNAHDYTLHLLYSLHPTGFASLLA